MVWKGRRRQSLGKPPSGSRDNGSGSAASPYVAAAKSSAPGPFAIGGLDDTRAGAESASNGDAAKHSANTSTTSTKPSAAAYSQPGLGTTTGPTAAKGQPPVTVGIKHHMQTRLYSGDRRSWSEAPMGSSDARWILPGLELHSRPIAAK